MKLEAPKFDESQNPNISHDTSHLGELRAMLGYLLLTILLVWLLVEAIVWSLPYTVSLQRERAWFSFVGKHLLADASIKHDPNMQELADQLAVHMNLPANSVDVYISDDDTPNAFATFGGNVVLYRGLLNRLPNEESVAAVLAHEMGHIKHRDPMRGMTRNLLYSVFAAAFGSEAQLHNLVHLESLRYSRELEYRADAEAVHAVVGQYRSAAGVTDLFRTLQTVEQEYKVAAYPTWLSTHPATAQRIEHAQTIATQIHATQTPAALPNRWQKK
ncbi:M48 family metallopeptidase [Wielerella bovis]|uniref:M48 family metallopeptidase n=1 Tax=Wielerella bovis TaxID=2917790 RepID=UPI0020184003|nr:M48 family metallopeptidase [Wielerella bovis]ULJ64955.1 M48 family metallopeptidase [Wielerella bovis]ULJ67229.1 M48 family metallopeptidase [Wielerella bovis]